MFQLSMAGPKGTPLLGGQEKTEEKKAETKEEEKKLNLAKPGKSCSSRINQPLPPVHVKHPQKPWWM